MGSVWLADHLRLQSQVAVKFMAPAVADDQVSIRRFQQEAKAAAEIRSPHVVQVFDHGQTDDGMLYIVMELLEGESLDRRVRERGPMGPSEVAIVVTHACKALAKAHERGIIHRDIKPANVFLLGGGTECFVKLLDFGVAKFSGEEAINMTAAGNMVGTPAFMSPEQLFHGKEVDHRGDLWSLAVVAYFALTGRRPFEGKTLGELCVSIKRGTFPLPSSLIAGTPPEVDAWFMRAFHHDLELRFQTAKETAQAFEEVCGVASVMGSTPSAVAAAPVLQTFPGTSVTSQSGLAVPPEPKRWPAVLGAAIAVAIGVGGAAVLFGGGSTRPAAGGGGDAGRVGEPAGAGGARQAEAGPEASADDEMTADAESDDPDAEGVEVTVEVEPPDGTSAAPVVPRPVAPRPSGPGPLPKPTPGDDTEDDRSKRAAEELGI